MNILIINSAKEWGGTEKWALYAAGGLARLGHAVYFGCRGDLFDRRCPPGVRIVKFPFANNADVVTLAGLYFFMRKKRIDAVLPSKQREYLLAGAAAKLASGVRVAGIFGIDRPIHSLRSWIAFCRLFDIVFVCAKKIIDVLARTDAFDTAKCRLVYVGVEPIDRSEKDRKTQRAALGLAENETCIMGIGRLAPQKGFDYAIEACALLVKQYPAIKLVIVGGGGDAPYRQQAERAGIADKVIFTGFRTDIHELIQAADIFWLTSRSEGIPNVMLEAMAARIPVVAFDIAGVAEILRDNENGLLVPFEAIETLAGTTSRLIGDTPLMRRIGECGYTTVREGYSMEKMSADMERALVELVGKRKNDSVRGHIDRFEEKS